MYRIFFILVVIFRVVNIFSSSGELWSYIGSFGFWVKICGFYLGGVISIMVRDGDLLMNINFDL